MKIEVAISPEQIISIGDDLAVLEKNRKALSFSTETFMRKVLHTVRKKTNKLIADIDEINEALERTKN